MKKCSECGGTYYAKNLCVKHYFKSRRVSTRELITEDSECASEGCERRPRAKRLCGTHYNKAKGYSKATSGVRGRPVQEVVDYRAAHKRVEQVKGMAADHDCVDCGGRASEWSLSHDAQEVLTSLANYDEGKPYSLNVEDYEPRCRPCHRVYDGREHDSRRSVS